MLLLLFFTLIICINSHDVCVFHDSSDNTEIPLHLEWFSYNNILLEAKDNHQDFMYYYSPCRNDVSCGSGEYSTGQIEQSWTNNVCYIVSQYDDDIAPEYNITTQTWKFYYDNGWSFHCSPPASRDITIYWHCNMSTDGIITLVHELNAPSCDYEMYIDSKWACLGQIPSHPKNKNKFWEHPMFIIIAIITACFIGSIVTIVIIWCLYKRCQRRKEIKDLINDILQDDDGDYGATTEGADIDMKELVVDLSKFKNMYPNLDGKDNKNTRRKYKDSDPAYTNDY